MLTRKKIIVGIVVLAGLVLLAQAFRMARHYYRMSQIKDPYIFEFDSLKWDKCEQKDFVYDNFNINSIADSLLLLTNHFECEYVEYSKDSLPVYKYESKTYNHPSVFFLYSIRNLNDFKATKHDMYLKKSIRYYNEAMKTLVPVDSASLFPFPFDFKLHGYKNQVMKAPWYSGFTQAISILINTRLFKVTGDSMYLKNMKRSFNGYSLLKADAAKHNGIWLSCIDKNKNLWLEEYPQEYPGFTLNGKVFSIMALYEAYQTTKDEAIKKYLLAAITTIKKNVAQYRNPGKLSSYCLKHRTISQHYHWIHINQLRVLNLITGDRYFDEMANNFAADSLNVK